MRGLLRRVDTDGRIFWGNRLAVLVALAGLGARAQEVAIDPAYPPSYFEFGMVVALGQRNVEVQTFDENKRKLVQHSFALTRESHADRVQVGDAVEVIYVQGGGGWTLRRLLLLSGGIPMMGPPMAGRTEAAGGTRLPTQSAGAVVPGTKAVTLVPGATGKRSNTAARPVTLSGSPARIGSAEPQTVRLATGALGTAISAEVPVVLGRASTAKVAEVVDVPLAGAEASVKVPEMKERAVILERPSEECNRSAADWPVRPLSLAVLDFRYPTEREEAHDVGRTSGGSGTAVADLVFARLARLPEFALSRGDRQKLYRADFAGAARVGRQLGVDAVLAGTFVPVEEVAGADGFVPPTRAWELRAGVVDTCTGQLLMRLYSAVCAGEAGTIDPGTAGAGACKRYSVTSAEAADPEANAAAFTRTLDAMLYPLEHNSTPAEQSAAGVVTEVGEQGVTVRLAAGGSAKAGDVFAVRARRLAKNPATYTLQTLQDGEIGRVTVSSVRGAMLVGAFAGEIPPHAGDVVEAVRP